MSENLLKSIKFTNSPHFVALPSISRRTNNLKVDFHK